VKKKFNINGIAGKHKQDGIKEMVMGTNRAEHLWVRGKKTETHLLLLGFNVNWQKLHKKSLKQTVSTLGEKRARLPPNLLEAHRESKHRNRNQQAVSQVHS